MFYPVVGKESTPTPRAVGGLVPRPDEQARVARWTGRPAARGDSAPVPGLPRERLLSQCDLGPCIFWYFGFWTLVHVRCMRMIRPDSGPTFVAVRLDMRGEVYSAIFAIN